ncbi:MAG: hypothetical protein PVG65_04560 [Candidatus Thorarchaeota archaeon]|jgi:hypothetical protein
MKEQLLSYIDYELVNAEDCFDDDNEGLIYGIHWLDEDRNVLDCEWFKTEEEREKNLIKTAFHTICQESWETLGNATLMDERIIDLILSKLIG